MVCMCLDAPGVGRLWNGSHDAPRLSPARDADVARFTPPLLSRPFLQRLLHKRASGSPATDPIATAHYPLALLSR